MSASSRGQRTSSTSIIGRPTVTARWAAASMPVSGGASDAPRFSARGEEYEDAFDRARAEHVDRHDSRDQHDRLAAAGLRNALSVACRPRRDARVAAQVEPLGAEAIGAGRSEEHTSELQSLMRISYAVFCLKKKKRPP